MGPNRERIDFRLLLVVLVVQVALILRYLAVAERTMKKNAAGVVGSGLAVLLVAMWVGVLTILSAGGPLSD